MFTRLCMRKKIASATLLLSSIVLSSCAFLGYDTSVPVIASHSGSENLTSEGSSLFVELSKTSEDSEEPVSSDFSEEESVPDESSEASQPAEETSAIVLEEYECDGFYIKGYELDDVAPLIEKIKPIIENASAHVSVYYEDLASGRSLSYDAQRKYKAGSVTKAPYSKYLIASGVDLDETIVMTAAHVMTGSGSLQYQKTGTSYTVRQLIDYAVRESDNTAYKMLYQKFGFDGFNEYSEALGSSVKMNNYDVWGDLTAEDAAEYFRDIYKFETENESASVLMSALKNSTYQYLIPSGIGEIVSAHKYGYMSGTYKVLHDVGIVYTDDPYILAIMTDFNPQGGNGRKIFTDISRYIKDFAVSQRKK